MIVPRLISYRITSESLSRRESGIAKSGLITSRRLESPRLNLRLRSARALRIDPFIGREEWKGAEIRALTFRRFQIIPSSQLHGQQTFSPSRVGPGSAGGMKCPGYQRHNVRITKSSDGPEIRRFRNPIRTVDGVNPERKGSKES
jgi:hypothetical protein